MLILGGTPYIQAIWVCVAVDMVLWQFSLGYGIKIRQLWSRTGCKLLEKWPVYNLVLNGVLYLGFYNSN